jgi:hypothetical protein
MTGQLQDNTSVIAPHRSGCPASSTSWKSVNIFSNFELPEFEMCSTSISTSYVDSEGFSGLQSFWTLSFVQFSKRIQFPKHCVPLFCVGFQTMDKVQKP